MSIRQHFDPRQLPEAGSSGLSRSMVTHKLINVLGCNGKA